MSSHKTLVEALESSLGFHLSPQEVFRTNLTGRMLSDASHAVDAFYENFELPKKESSEFRPFFRRVFSNEPSLGHSYVSDSRHYTTGSYAYDHSEESKLVQEIKKQLLYSHSICFFDPLQYLLDYFHDTPDDEFAAARLPAVKALLYDYAQIAGLIRAGIVIPVSGGPLSLSEIPSLSDAEKATLRGSLPQFDKKLVLFMTQDIQEGRAWSRRFQHRVDPILPDHKSVEIYRQFLRLIQGRFTSSEILEPFQVSLFGSVSSINPEAISVADIIRIRMNDELFAEWRLLLKRVLRTLYNRKNQFTDLDREFAETFREEVNIWNDQLAKAKRKSAVTRQIVSSSGKIGMGAVAGTIGGALTGVAVAGPGGGIAGSVIGGVIGGVASPALESIRDLVRTLTRRPDVTTIRHHFLALNVDDG
jgi:hypothetical protein